MKKYHRRETITLYDRSRQTVASAIRLNIGRQKKTILPYSMQREKNYKKSKSIALFLGFSSEIITDSLIKHAWKEKKNVLLPITSQGFHKPFFALFHKGDRLKRTSFGPMELVKKKKPFNFRSIDLVVIPGLGFDERGYRLGYGGGVYDRILKKTPRAKHVGLFFSCQFLPKLPTGRHDKSMDAIVTERSFLPF